MTAERASDPCAAYWRDYRAFAAGAARPYRLVSGFGQGVVGCLYRLVSGSCLYLGLRPSVRGWPPEA